MENNRPSVFLIHELASSGEFFRKLKIRYAIFLSKERFLEDKKIYPEVFNGAELVESFKIMRSHWTGDRAFLYRLHPAYLK
jgi:hypothetical protein